MMVQEPGAMATYQLPAYFALALNTNRPEMLDVYIAELRAMGTVAAIPFEQQIEIVRLVRDMLADRNNASDRIDGLEDTIAKLSDYIKDAQQYLAEALVAVKAVE